MATMQQYRGGYPQQGPGRSPHAPARRGQGPVMAHPQNQMAQQASIQAQHMQLQHDRDLAKRRSRRPTDKTIPEAIEPLVIGDGVRQHKELRDLERRLDSTMMRKRMDISDAIKPNVKIFKTLRIWVSNTVENQPWQQQEKLTSDSFDFTPSHDGTFRVKIEGRLLDEGEDDPTVDSDDEEDAAQEKNPDAMDEDVKPKTKPSRPRKKLSDFFQNITIKFNQRHGALSTLPSIEWIKPLPQPNAPAGAPKSGSKQDNFDSLEFQRRGDENLNCTISLTRYETPVRYKLSPELAEVLDTDESDKASAFMGVWEYVKAMKLQEDEEKRTVRCDERLRALFKHDTVFFPHIPDLLTVHFLPLPPVNIPFTIRMDQAFHENPEPTIYDVRVAMEHPLRSLCEDLLSSPTYPDTLRQLSVLDDRLALIVQALGACKAKHGFLTAAAQNPALFIQRWIASQKRDLETLLGESGKGIEQGFVGRGDEWRRGGADGVWGTEEARETVTYWLATTDQARSRK